ncbi:MAG: FecR domain-containing protein [Chitinophagaceae bacterium]|nr:FecR domain-containing protein [Chitinophagaceae bacterium]
MNYTSWSLEDFLSDERFIHWCYGTDPGDVDHWEGIRGNDPELAQRMDQARQMCLMLSVRADAGQKREDWKRLEKRLGVGASVRMMWMRRVAVAAVVILLAGGVWVWKNGGAGRGLYATSSFHALATTGFDGRKTVELPDGSVVLLNAFSELRIAPDFNKGNRRVELKGEAFFRVQEDPARPFMVMTGNTAVTVLGTSFKVRNYGSDGSCSVMLDAGKVSVESIGGKKPSFKEILLPGDQLVVEHDNTISRGKFDTGSLEKWMKGQVAFREAGLDEIRSRLHELFGVEIVAGPRTKDPILFTGSFDGKSLKDILDAVGFTNNFTYTISHDTVTLKY